MKPPSNGHSLTDLQLKCWCGATEFGQSAHQSYAACCRCGTAVIREPSLLAAKATDSVIKETYSEDFWTQRQLEVGLPSIEQRARLDLPERCLYWLTHILRHRLPPGRILEIGCAHGALVKLLDMAGYQTIGMEMDESIVSKAQAWFDIDVVVGPVELLPKSTGMFDVIVMLDVLEHLPQPVETVRAVTHLLKPAGLLVIQSPEYRPTRKKAWTNFVVPEHLFLFTRESVFKLLRDVGLMHVHFEKSIFPDDFFLFSSAQPLNLQAPSAVENSLCSSGNGRIILAMLDLWRDKLSGKSSRRSLGNLSRRLLHRLRSSFRMGVSELNRH